MQSFRNPLRRSLSKKATFSLNTQVRLFSNNSVCQQENKLHDFPWLLSKDKPRITKFPYEKAPYDWSFLNLLPNGLQHVLAKWLGTRVLQLNTGQENFPDQFLVGASLATRKALSLLSQQLNQPEQHQQDLEHMLGPDLLDRFIKAAPSDMNIDLQMPQVYDVNTGDIWISLGNPAAFTNEQKYDVLRWMTVQVGLQKTTNENEESFQDYRERVSKSILEGVQVGVDVLIDADVVYKASMKDNPDETVLYDQGRRVMQVRFATPYFSPASKMVSGRDPETGEPVNDWSWRLVDIDQLLEKESMDSAGIEEQDE